MRQFEYKKEIYKATDLRDVLFELLSLNEEGRSGWELVQIVPSFRSNETSYYFKRRLYYSDCEEEDPD